MDTLLEYTLSKGLIVQVERDSMGYYITLIRGRGKVSGRGLTVGGALKVALSRDDWSDESLLDDVSVGTPPCVESLEVGCGAICGAV